MDISKNITYYRSQKGVTQQWLADAIDVSKMSISHFENGKRRPDIATIKKICKALDVTLGKFMAYNEGVTVFNGSFRKSDNLAASQQDAIVAQIRYAAQRYYDACLCANTVCDANTLPKEKIPVFEDANRSASVYAQRSWPGSDRARWQSYQRTRKQGHLCRSGRTA